MDKVRIDKWLWAARFFKTRSLAKSAIEGGKVQIDGNKSKASRQLELGTILTIRQGFDSKTVEVIGLSEQRRGGCMNQNNTVNIYEEYFDGNEIEHCSEPPFAKGLAVFRDPSPVTRTATSVNWHPEGSNNGKVAVSYSVLDFQDERLNNPDMLASVRSD